MHDGDADGSTEWHDTLRNAVARSNEIGVAKVFSALAWNDGEQIALRARRFLEAFAPYYFAEEGTDAATLEQRMRTDLFCESVLAYLEGKEAEVEHAVERDIPAWIQSNAPAIASANLHIMEGAFGRRGAATHRDVVRLHQLMDLPTFERVQQRTLEQTWGGIETTLADVLVAGLSR
jgi:hypothetical protein